MHKATGRRGAGPYRIAQNAHKPVGRGLAPAAPCAFTPPSLPEGDAADAAREDAARRREKRPIVGERHARIARALLPCAYLALV